MAEAIFSLSADITPQIDDRELERQAQLISRQLNNLLAKQVDKVSIQPTSNFRPFQQELDKSRGSIQRLQDSLSRVPRSLGNIARQGRSAFLKFTDAVNITRREFVGFGKGIRDTIRDTNLFEDALDGIKSVGGTIAELPEQFQDLAAQVRSGTSVIDQMAAGGNQLAQMFQPLQQQGEAARTEFVELNRSIDLLTGAVQNLASSSKETGSVIEDQFGQPLFNQQIRSMEELLQIVPEGSVVFNKLKGSIDQANQAGTLDAIQQELLEAKNEAQRLTGPLGRIAQLINERSGGRFFADVTKESREAAIALEQGVIDKLRELGGGALLGPIERLNSILRSLQGGAEAVGRGLQATGRGIATVSEGFLKITGLAGPVGQLVNSVDTVLADVVTGIRGFGNQTREALSSIVSSLGTIAVGGLDRALAPLAGTIGKKLGQVAGFLETNLNTPMRQGLQTLKTEVQRLGGEIAGGLSKGMQAGRSALGTAVTSIKDTIVGGIKRLFQISSPSKVMERLGGFIIGGLVGALRKGAGAVASAIGALGAGLGSLASQAAEFAKSAGVVAGVAFAGLGASALLAGKEFNVLKQVINSTLPVIVGSKQAAAGLLAEVNELNDTSPYARSSFLELTRVLAGFGVEAEKITPLIDAIQQTVAATGGTDQDLLELGQAFARIQSQGRLSLDVLQSFSSRGVDAIAILGAEMGKTTSEIRDMISNGLIPADKAIDILTRGLKEKFDGATDAVAKNFPGALQRVQARLRDIGGTLLNAFITPEGGGALVTFLNNMADSLSHINKNVLPALAPMLQKIADFLVVASEKVETFVKSLSGADFSKFIGGLGPVLPLLAAFLGFMPQMLSFIPVVGPLIAGLGGPFTALAAAIGVLLVQSGNFGSVMERVSSVVSGAFTFIKENVSGLIVALGSIISIGNKAGATLAAGAAPVGKLGQAFAKVSPHLTKALGAIGPLGKALKVLSGPVGIIISIIVQLVLTSQKFRESLGRLFEAVKPVAEVIMGALAVAIKVLDEALKALEPVFVLIVDLVAAWFRSLTPVIDALKALIKGAQDSKVIENIFKGVGEAVQWATDTIRWFIKQYNRIPGLPDIKLDVDDNPLKKSQKEIEKNLKAQKKAAEDASSAITDNYTAAAKAVENANAKVSSSIDAVKQAISTMQGVMSPLFEAARAVQTANAAIETARTKHSEATADVTSLEKEKAQAIADAISPVNELVSAERNLTRIRNGLRDITQEVAAIEKDNIKISKENTRILEENAKIQEDTAKRQGKWAGDQRAQLLRDEERAQIALNKAQQAEIDLLNELNGANKINIDLTGLSLDQIRTKLAAARATAKARKGERDKTPQEIADAKRSASLDVEDARANAADATAAKQEFEIENQEQIDANNEKILENLDKIEENGIRIRENQERLAEIELDRLDVMDDEIAALKEVEKLRLGETTQAKIILDYDEKIRDAKVIQRNAAKDIDTATHNAAVSEKEFALKAAEARGDVDAILKAQGELYTLQFGDLYNSNITLRNIMGEQRKNVESARDAAREMNVELQKANKALGAATAVQGAGTALSNLEHFAGVEARAIETGDDRVLMRLYPKIDAAKASLYSSLRTALGSGAAEQKARNQEPWFPNPGQIEAVIRKIDEIFGRNKNLRDAIRDALNSFGLSMPGFAAAHGYAPGDLVHQGMNNGVGVMRWAEFGKEAILPLTRKFDMARVVNNPQVLPKILDALPRWSRPDVSGDTSIAEISSAVRSARSGGGPANADVYERKAQREFAGAIGEAVKMAVKEALEESDSLGADVDINVMPSTGNERLIAREVKRQVDKALGKW